ncbi:Integrase catalytic domain-containing protein [Durusdinium trenchii]|uniref:Integrase catalytic domain-containing protein n=1 Tax=Durusdinium trenchii TaxID=1381693 RepID=A0ABP0HNP5_9DINO
MAESLPGGWTRSELDALEEQLHVDSDPGAASSIASRDNPWRCLRCNSARWREVSAASFVCVRCQYNQFYHVEQPTRQQTVDGTWLYLPSTDSAPIGSLASAQLRRQSVDPLAEDVPSPPDPAAEHPESEEPTDDPSLVASSRYDWPVDPPEQSGSSSSRSRRRRRRGNTTAQQNDSQHDTPDAPSPSQVPLRLPTSSKTRPDGQSELVQALKQVLEERRNDSASDKSWNSRKGPAPGLKWRGGTPPQPPKWQYHASDLRAFAKYERRVQVWQMQVQHYLTGAEAGLMLFSSLTGEPEAEAEHMELEKVNAKDGVSYILGCLKGPLEQKLLYQKRMLLSNYESITRQSHESIRQFINRYKRVERDLQTVGISSAAMYDSESRGNRLLERCKLDPQLQRLVLIGAHSSLQFDAIVESLQLQFPDFRPTPPVFQSGGWRPSSSGSSSYKGSNYPKSMASTSASSSASTLPSSASAYNRGKGGKGPRRVFQTEVADTGDADVVEAYAAQDLADEQPEEFFETIEENLDEDNEAIAEDGEAPDDDLDASLQDLAQVLSVTSKKLQATVLGRKFTGRKSIDERKRTSTCSACGAIGHWAGDAACSVSSSTKGSSKGGKKGKDKHGGKDKSGGQPSSSSTTTTPKKAFVVSYGEEYPGEDLGHDMFLNYPTSFVDSVHSPFVYVTQTIDLGGYMVLDTACQRSCAGQRWMQTHARLLDNHGMGFHREECHDRFQFGAGSTQQAAERCLFPASFAGQETQGIIFGVSILPLSIPFLASRVLLEQLGCVIDLHQGILHMSTIGVTLPLVKKHGHLVVNITSFPPRCHQLLCWKELAEDRFWTQPCPELVLHPEAVHAPSGSHHDRVNALYTPSTRMAQPLAHDPVEDPPTRVQRPQGHEQAGQDRHLASILVDSPRDTGAEGDAESSLGKTQTLQEDLHTSQLPSVWQCSRQVHRVPEVRSKVPLDAGPRRLGGVFAKVFQLIGAAYAVLSQYPDSQGLGAQDQGHEQQKQAQGSIHASENLQDILHGHQVTVCPQDGQRGWLPGHRIQPGGVRGDHVLDGVRSIPTELGWRQGRLSEEDDHWETFKNQCIRHHRIPRLLLLDLQHLQCPVPKHLLAPHCTAEVTYEDGSTETITYEWNNTSTKQLHRPWTGRTIFTVQTPAASTQRFLSNAARRTLRNNVRQAYHIYHIEHVLAGQVADDFDKFHNKRAVRPRVDVLETFAGAANITRRCQKFHLSAASPIDFNTGWDLRKAADQDQVDGILDEMRPLILIQGIDCKDWCLLQDNCNYVRRKILLLM